ncbi:uncharacterized protein BP5553_06199 [Venustampulla echinocandica]|uniref:Uncharacterized protein n=1 Tax=Venustampulla echinocandica TaxID=2656787 RepID=A0A370TMW5_9HELO|nr:uncharacterized protein BP5553_06199 [Venustampulla echinocandica]RDL36847.1 hypothetical protein BP5553_06199 [Venustampulla echinocandica]
MEALQMAQILADLSTLQSTVCIPSPLLSVCIALPSSSSCSSASSISLLSSPRPYAPHYQEPAAAQNLLDANKNLTPHILRRKSRASVLPEPPKFDKLGRRIIRGPSRSGNVTPIGGNAGGRPALLSRMSSGFSVGSSGTATPTTGASEEKDEDMARAQKLLELYEMRGKFQEMGDTGLARAKERVDKVVDQYAKKDLEEREAFRNDLWIDTGHIAGMFNGQQWARTLSGTGGWCAWDMAHITGAFLGV